MASNFDQALPTILKHEGGFVDNIHDPGGATNFGISLRYLQARGDLDGDGFLDGDIDRDGDVDADDIVAMDEQAAGVFYKTGFWYPGKYGLINDQELSTKAFDLGVNMGIKQGAKCVQRALMAAGTEVADDGAIGPVTIAAINDAAPSVLLAATRSEAAGFYRALILRNSALRKRMVDVPDFSVFKTGWLRRAYD